MFFGLSNFTKQTLAQTDVPKDTKRLLRSLTGYSKSSYKTSFRVQGGYLCGNVNNVNIDSNILTLVRIFVIANRWPIDYELQSFRRFESDEGQTFYSSHAKTWKTNSTVIEYIDNDSVCYGRIKIFVKLNNEGICVCDKLEENSNDFKFNVRDCDESLQSLSFSDRDRNRIVNVLQRYHNKALVKHHTYVKPSYEGPIIVSVKQIRRKCVFIDYFNNTWMISRFPNITEHN